MPFMSSRVKTKLRAKREPIKSLFKSDLRNNTPRERTARARDFERNARRENKAKGTTTSQKAPLAEDRGSTRPKLPTPGAALKVSGRGQ